MFVPQSAEHSEIAEGSLINPRNTRESRKRLNAQLTQRTAPLGIEHQRLFLPAQDVVLQAPNQALRLQRGGPEVEQQPALQV